MYVFYVTESTFYLGPVMFDVLPLREKCLYSDFFGPYFPAFGLNINMDWKNSEYGLFLPSVPVTFIKTYLI